MSAMSRGSTVSRCSTGELIRAYRLVVGATQETFARRSGLSLATLSALERDACRPCQGDLERIARAFSAELLNQVPSTIHPLRRMTR